MNFTVISAVILLVFVFSIVSFLASRFRRCPSNQILAVYGKFATGGSVRCYHGGGTFVWPLIQDYSYLDLIPMAINIPLKNALSMQNIRINVPSTFTVAINTTPESMNNAAVRLLGLGTAEIEKMASEIIFGQLRLTVASLTIEQINQDREKFLEAIRNNIDPELRKVGLYLINVNITDITDESGYIESIGKKAAATAINQAKIDVAEQEKKGAIGSAEADKDKRIQVASFNASAVEGENSAKANISIFNADLAEKEAKAAERGQIAQQRAIAAIQKETAMAEESRLLAKEIVPKEIDKKKVEIDAEAAAQRRRLEAAGEADAILSVLSAEAAGTQKVLDAKALGYNNLINACENNPQQVATLLMVEKMEQLVSLQAQAISNLKIDKITVWDTGNGEKGSSTANFLSNMVKSLPALHDIAAMAGVEMPKYLGEIKENSSAENISSTVEKNQ
jgi:flotillin